MSQFTREHPATDDDGIKPLELSRQDRRKMYAMLDANLPPRITRIEMALAVVVPSNVALLWKVFGEPTPVKAVTSLIQTFFG